MSSQVGDEALSRFGKPLISNEKVTGRGEKDKGDISFKHVFKKAYLTGMFLTHARVGYRTDDTLYQNPTGSTEVVLCLPTLLLKMALSPR